MESIRNSIDNQGGGQYLPVFGCTIETRMIRDLKLNPVATFAHLHHVENLQGDNAGYVKVYEGENLIKAISLSLELVSGMRYFFIHVVPDAKLEAPRYSFDGVLTDQGSRVALDLYPDQDLALNLDELKARYAGINKIYEAAREDKTFNFECSRMAYIRAACSPYFLGVFSAMDADLPRLETYADTYFSEWLKNFRSAEKLSDDEARIKLIRREQIAHAIREGNYMERVVSDIYGEKLCEQICDAVAP